MILAAAMSVTPGLMRAQFDFQFAGREVQIHSFGSQGFAGSDQNNFLTMKTSQGSFAYTEVGGNISMQITDKLRIGAQIYDHDIGNLGQWHPELDWALADYRFKDWFGIRGGKVKTTFGLYNDTQDFDFLHTYAIMPTSIYPMDLRSSTIAHEGGDIYGTIGLKKMGNLAYTVYAGERRDSLYGGYIYLLDPIIPYTSYGGLQVGEDLRWNTPLKGLMVGVSHLGEDIRGIGTTALFGPAIAEEEHTNRDWANQLYGTYSIGNLRIDAEYRRWWRDQEIFNKLFSVTTDTRSWYAATAYRFSKRLELGGYYSHFIADARSLQSAPGNHLIDKVVTARIDLKKYWDLKIEGHFMDGTGGTGVVPGAVLYPNGFYPIDNPQGLHPKTTMIVIKTGFNF